MRTVGLAALSSLTALCTLPGAAHAQISGMGYSYGIDRQGVIYQITGTSATSAGTARAIYNLASNNLGGRTFYGLALDTINRMVYIEVAGGKLYSLDLKASTLSLSGAYNQTPTPTTNFNSSLSLLSYYNSDLYYIPYDSADLYKINVSNPSSPSSRILYHAGVSGNAGNVYRYGGDIAINPTNGQLYSQSTLADGTYRFWTYSLTTPGNTFQEKTIGYQSEQIGFGLDNSLYSINDSGTVSRINTNFSGPNAGNKTPVGTMTF